MAFVPIESSCTRITTEYGFVLITEDIDGSWQLEAYGLAGLGRYELFFSCGYAAEDKVENGMADAEQHADADIYKKTSEALNTIEWLGYV